MPAMLLLFTLSSTAWGFTFLHANFLEIVAALNCACVIEPNKNLQSEKTLPTRGMYFRSILGTIIPPFKKDCSLAVLGLRFDYAFNPT